MFRKGGFVYEGLKGLRPIRAAVHAAQGALQRYRPTAWRLEGQERGTGVPLTIVFAGQLESKNYVRHLAFSGQPVETKLGGQWVWRVLPPLAGQRGGEGVDVTLVELDRFQRRMLAGRYSFNIPRWIGGEVDLRKALEHMRASRHIREDLRRMQRQGMSREVARSEESFDRFYRSMYRPYIARAHGDRACFMGYDEMMSRRHECELLLLRVRGEPVGGMIILYEGPRPRAWSVGVQERNDIPRKPGPLKALDYLAIEHLAGLGYARAHMGASRPFLRDGVLRKKRWLGLSIVDHTERGFALRATAGSPGARAFLAGNPFIFEQDGDYVAALFVAGDEVPSTEQIRHWEQQYAIPGVRHLALIDLRPQAGPARLPAAAAVRRSRGRDGSVPGWRTICIGAAAGTAGLRGIETSVGK